MLSASEVGTVDKDVKELSAEVIEPVGKLIMAVLKNMRIYLER